MGERRIGLIALASAFSIVACAQGRATRASPPTYDLCKGLTRESCEKLEREMDAPLDAADLAPLGTSDAP